MEGAHPTPAVRPHSTPAEGVDAVSCGRWWSSRLNSKMLVTPPRVRAASTPPAPGPSWIASAAQRAPNNLNKEHAGLEAEICRMGAIRAIGLDAVSSNNRVVMEGASALSGEIDQRRKLHRSRPRTK